MSRLLFHIDIEFKLLLALVVNREKLWPRSILLKTMMRKLNRNLNHEASAFFIKQLDFLCCPFFPFLILILILIFWYICISNSLEDTRHFINFSLIEVNIWSDFYKPSVQ